MTNRLNGVKIALSQMKVAPGRPDVNTSFIVNEILEAEKRGVDIIFFPELCTTGYFIGDLFENEAFLRDTALLNRAIRESTKGGIVAVVGTPVLVPMRKGENGFQRVLNAAVLYANGRYIGHAVKTLQPNYRIFKDDRHFFSLRKIAAEEGRKPERLIRPFTLPLKGGRSLRLGVTICEDMWKTHYLISPVEILARKGAEIICNISASPWTWQKNRKRHEVVKTLAGQCGVPFVYVNNTGMQNVGKNFAIFDGCSALYNARGDAVYTVPPYADGTHDVTLDDTVPAFPEAPQDDTKELYEAIRCGIREFFASLPPSKRRIIIGVSGGIDSSLSAGLYAVVLGAENVVGVNMPSKFSQEKTQRLARALAANLGIAYEVRPVQGVIDAIASGSGVREGTLAHENIQARARMEILAARAQELGCLFSANWNKVEASFGYGTMYGDMAGAVAAEGDLWKREIYQVADYLNRAIFGREAIPQECFDIPPSAELSFNQRDPFDYGNLSERGFHEEMARSFVEFGRDPEWLLERYRDGMLEQELMLAPGKLKRLFPESRQFVRDVEKHWRLFRSAYVKRIQSPPMFLLSKRGFGNDLEESLIPPHFTSRYCDLQTELLSRDIPRVAIYGGSFNPPAAHHRQIAEQLIKWFRGVVVTPCGTRTDKDALQETPFACRKTMAQLNFGDLPGVAIDTDDLDTGVFTPQYALDEKYKSRYTGSEIWHVVGWDLINGGRDSNSEIQRLWKKGAEIWSALNFTVIVRPGFVPVQEDLPPRSELFEIEHLVGSSTAIRAAIAEGGDAGALLMPEVREYIQRNGLYKSKGNTR